MLLMLYCVFYEDMEKPYFMLFFMKGKTKTKLFHNFPFFACKSTFHLVKCNLLKKSVKEVLSWLSVQFVKKVLISETM